MNVSRCTAEFKLINQMSVDWPHLSLMHTAPFWLQKEISDWQQCSNVTLDISVTLVRIKLITGFRSCTRYLLREGKCVFFQLWASVNGHKTTKFPFYFYSIDSLLREGEEGHFERWWELCVALFSFSGKQWYGTCWGEPRCKTPVWPFLPVSVCRSTSAGRQKL